MPMIHELCGGVAVPLNIQIADRIIDSLNTLSTAKHKRLTLEQERIPSMLWFIQYTLSTIMFSGVLLIVSGSLELNIFMCFCTSVMIGVNSLFIADMDMPYIGYLSISKEPLEDLVRDMKLAAEPAEKSAKLRNDSRPSNPLEVLANRVIASQRLLVTRMRSSFIGTVHVHGNDDDDNLIQNSLTKSRLKEVQVHVQKYDTTLKSVVDNAKDHRNNVDSVEEWSEELGSESKV